MKNTIEIKLNQHSAYSEQEIEWCLSNIGNPNSDIRDDLVYSTFCHGFEHQLITKY